MATTFEQKKPKRGALKRITAGDVMRRSCVSVQASDSASYAAEFLRTYGIEKVPVTDSANRVIGALSVADLFDAWGRRSDRRSEATGDDLAYYKTNAGIYPELPQVTVGQIMNPEPVCVLSDASIAKVMESFVKHKVRRVFVTDEDGVLLGDISVFDLLRALGECVAPKRFRRQRP